MPERLAKYLWAALCWALVIAALWLALRFLLPWLAPFLVALGAAALMEPAVGALARHGWRRSVAAGLVTLAVLASLVISSVASNTLGRAAYRSGAPLDPKTDPNELAGR